MIFADSNGDTLNKTLTQSFRVPNRKIFTESFVLVML